METKKNIRSLDKTALKEYLVSIGEKPFRASQIYDWMWKKGVHEFSKMSNLPPNLRDALAESFVIHKLTVDDAQKSSDGTLKSAFRLYDGNVVEGVLIPTKHRTTACISTQVGCSLSCAFCATGKMGRIRNLSADEIYDQVVEITKQSKKEYQSTLSNIVYMGMGEPLLNYSETLRSIEMITSKEGLAMSPKRITVSTAGIAKMIRKLGDDDVKFNLAISLHAATDVKRSEIMEINNENSLSSLSEALVYFHDKTGSRITFEYILFHDFNDSLDDAASLARFCRAFPVKINLIEYNPVEGVEFKKTLPERTDAFARFLEDKNMIVNVRRSRGKDIDAACGQLANKNKAIT
ncbi:MAG: 23S rRNA (adenine(2503)-C(2))-methyltransferase RlmN [Bacteroidetes bacterium]|nr:MAG: 23S rRNA (adenine(2503)-C(2))-methyltransferase RlmN [Bacteroidota bacterium]